MCAHELARIGLSWDSDHHCIVCTDPLPEIVNNLVVCDFINQQYNKVAGFTIIKKRMALTRPHRSIIKWITQLRSYLDIKCFLSFGRKPWVYKILWFCHRARCLDAMNFIVL